MNELRIVEPEHLVVRSPWHGFCKITPAQAARWLELNTGNRRIRKTLVAYLATEIISGEWQEELEPPISFSTLGRLIDGQHRLMAIIKANQSVWTRVRMGVDDKLFKYFDTGISRTLEDRMVFLNNPMLNRAACQILTRFHCTSKNGIKRGNAYVRITPDDATALWEEWGNDITAVLQSFRKSKGVGHATLLHALTLVHRRYPSDAEAFYADLICVDPVSQQARRLRSYLREGLRKVVGGGSLTTEIFERALFAIRAFIEKREITALRRMPLSDWPELRKESNA
jgi:hypothetical protein